MSGREGRLIAQPQIFAYHHEMRETPWFKAVIGGTWHRVFSRHLRIFRPKSKAENENERRAG